MSFPVLPHGFLGSQGDSDGYRIERSLRFNDDDAAYLSRTFGTPTDGKKCTLSLWYKRGNLGGSLSSYGGVVFAASGTNFFSIADNAASGSDELMLWYGNARTLTSTAKFRDPTAWYHLVVAFDSTQATAANRCKVYINGSEVTSWSTDARSNITLNSTITFNTTSISALISGYLAGGVGQYDGYLAEYYFVDGQALTPSTFGDTDSATGRWKAKQVSGLTYGNNGFYLNFSDNSGTTATTLGKDSSGKGNNWTPNNFSVTAGAGNDSLVDSPTNNGTDSGVGGEVRGNYCTLNPLSNTGGTMLDGNMDFYGASAWRFAGGTIAVSSGKWYIEANKSGASTGNTESNVFSFFGFIKPSTLVASGSSHTSYTTSVIGIGDSGWAYNFGSGTSVTTGFGSGDVASIAIDFVAGTYNIRKNNTTVASGTMNFTGLLIPAIFSYASSSRWQPNFGQRPFAYTAPSGFKALCTTNLSKDTAITTSGSFTGNASADGPFVWLNGTPTTMTINGNAVTFGTHADRLAGGFKIRSSSASYNASGSNTFSVSTTDKKFKYARAQ
jgi:hypothetical protein